MKNTKSKPAKSKLALREPAKPLQTPETPLRSDHPMAELLKAASAQEFASMPSLTSLTSQTTPSSQSIAPARDFVRVPNSITRHVIPAGEFKGKSKQLYDCLYSMTRGAIQPVRSIRISRPQLMKKAGIGARVTFDTNIAHLSLIGLLQVKHIAGEHEGNEYTVYLPEERTLPSQSSQTSHAQDQDRLVSLESSQTRHTLSAANKDTLTDSKTSFKTIDQIDDDLGQRLRALERELTGKSSPSHKWTPLFELLTDELKAAASRTGSVSDAPAFFAEHLRRRLAKPEAPQRRGEGKRTTEPAPLSVEEIAPPAPDDVEEFERARAELEGK